MLRGRVTNIEQLANRSFNILNFENTPARGNQYYDGIPPALRRIVKGNPITQVEKIIQISTIVVDTVPPTYASNTCLLYTSPSPRDRQKSRMPSSA